MTDIETFRTAYRAWKLARTEYDELIDAMMSGSIPLDKDQLTVAVKHLSGLHKEFMDKAKPFVYPQ